MTGPLQEGDVVRVRRVDPPARPDDDDWDDTRTVTAGDGSADCEAPAGETAAADERDAFSASFYTGWAFDNFAPGAVGGYPENAQDGAERKRYVMGIDFEFHVAGDGDRQLWIFGETVNGVRAADVACAGDTQPAVCSGTLTDNPGDQFRYVLENASSKEAFFGVRLELERLNADTDFPTRFYVTGQLGVMMLTGRVAADLAETDLIMAQEAYSAHYIGAGLLSFLQLFADFDPTDKTADSIQTFVGIDFDLAAVFP